MHADRWNLQRIQIFSDLSVFWGYTGLFQSPLTSVYPSWDLIQAPVHFHICMSNRRTMHSRQRWDSKSAVRSASKGIETKPQPHCISSLLQEVLITQDESTGSSILLYPSITFSYYLYYTHVGTCQDEMKYLFILLSYLNVKRSNNLE